ncbi:MAG: T9SS type A sorting domain-containing protein [Ignavibacteria bacterium]
MLKKIFPLIIIIVLTGILISQENPFYAPADPNEKNIQYSQPSFLDTNLVVNGSWSRLNNLPKSLIGVNTYYDSLTNRIFICGGADENAVPNDTCWWYDIAGGTYQQAPFLPQGRWLGKLVKVKNDLFLVGSVGSSFSAPDGLLYKYSLQQNSWSIADTMPAPFVHEAAVCVLNDSLIVTIGGSTNGYSGAKNYVRIFNPAINTWRNSTLFPVNITTAHAEMNILSTDISIFVLGGFNAGNLNTVYRGEVSFINSDTLLISWTFIGETPFNAGVYRVAGSKWKDYMLFGPAMNGAVSLNNIWGLNYSTGTGYWTNFMPVSGDTVGNISSFAAVTGVDSNYFYLFGGFKNPNILNTAQKYSFTNPPPIGIIHNNNIARSFRLYQNYPNPFNPVTKIRFDIPQGVKGQFSNVKLVICDLLGKIAAKYEYQGLKMGSYEIDFDGSNLASGIYFYTISDGVNSASKKMVIIK